MATADVKVPVAVEIHVDGQAVVVGPDDRLVVGLRGELSPELAKAWTETIERMGLSGRVIACEHAELALIPGESTTERDVRPHSRACGLRAHAHGSACHSNCPTCHGTAEKENH